MASVTGGGRQSGGLFRGEVAEGQGGKELVMARKQRTPLPTERRVQCSGRGSNIRPKRYWLMELLNRITTEYGPNGSGSWGSSTEQLPNIVVV